MADRAEFSGFAKEASRGLLRSAWLLTGDWSSAEDLVQVALTKTWARWESVERDRAVGYARQVMVRTHLRWRARRWGGETPSASLPELRDLADPLNQVELRSQLLAGLRALPRQQRAVIVLRYFDDLTEAATARVLGCTVGTVKSHTARALTALRAIPGLDSRIEGRSE